MRAITCVMFVLCFASITVGFGQDDRALEFRRQEEQRRKTEMLRHLDSAIVMIDEGEYTQADAKLKFVLDNIQSVPSDLTFYFGKNSFYLNRFKQSVDWLNKYIQLKGTSGQFYGEATELLKKAEVALISEKSKDAENAQQVLSLSYDIDCGPSGKVSCPVCKGDHVIIKRGLFGDEYRTCPYCNEHGILTCEEYNQLLRGELKKKSQ